MEQRFLFLAELPSVIRISGTERLDFLHRLTSQSFKTRKAGDFFYGACLKANGGVIGLFGALVRETDVLLMCLGRSAEPILKFLDQFHFGEDVRFQLDVELTVIQLFGEFEDFSGAAEAQVHRLPGPLQSVGREGVSLVAVSNELLVGPLEILRKIVLEGTARVLSSSEFTDHFAWSGLPEVGVDLTEDNILIEAPLDKFVHRTKGCYPGQEVIERIYTYGNVAKYILNVTPSPKLPGTLSPDVLKPVDLFLPSEGGPSKVGVLKSIRKNLDGQVFGVAQVQRIPAEKNAALTSAAGDLWQIQKNF